MSPQLPRVRRAGRKNQTQALTKGTGGHGGWVPREASADDGARGGGQASSKCIGQNWPRGDTHMALPTSGPTSCPSHSHGSLHWVLTPLLASADEECIRVSEDSRSTTCVSDLASAQPPSGNAHSGSRATDGARGQRLAGGLPALPHQRIGPRRFRRICMDCSAANRPPGKHPPSPPSPLSLEVSLRPGTAQMGLMDRCCDHGTAPSTSH